MEIKNATIQSIIRINAGHYRLDQFLFMFEKKPNWFHRKMMKLFFGFVWEDAQKK